MATQACVGKPAGRSAARAAPRASRRTAARAEHEAYSAKQTMYSRPRRNRRNETLRSMYSETTLRAANFILPVFIHEGEEAVPIGAMPGCYRQPWKDGLVEQVREAREYGVNNVILFPKVPDELKTLEADECYNQDGIVHRAIRNLKDEFPDVVVYTDVALDPYSSVGHDGIVDLDSGVVLNDATVHQLCKQAVSQAEAGADIVAPSDMMDGRIGSIREALDDSGFSHVGIMAYTAKYASSFYGPFREALDSNPKSTGNIPKDKKTYQMDPANWREAMRELTADEDEGADIMMVKPAMPYLDIIRLLHDNSSLPIAAYHVSGEYAMIKAAAEKGWLDEKAAALEALLSIKRAGADVILTYYATQAAKWLAGEE